MVKLYQICRWDEVYENNKSRLIDQCSWCPIPNKQDGLGYGRILLDPDGQGAAIYGCFVSIVLMASKQPPKREGWLTDTGRKDGRPLDATAISIKTRMLSGLVETTLQRMCMEDVGWMRVMDTSALQVPSKCPPSATEGTTKEGMKEGKKEGRKEEDVAAPLGHFSEAIAMLRKGHTAFLNVPDMALINELRCFPEERWEPAIKALLQRYAGATIIRPTVTLQNHLVGKQENNHGRVRQPSKPNREYDYQGKTRQPRKI